MDYNLPENQMKCECVNWNHGNSKSFYRVTPMIIYYMLNRNFGCEGRVQVLIESHLG